MDKQELPLVQTDFEWSCPYPSSNHILRVPLRMFLCPPSKSIVKGWWSEHQLGRPQQNNTARHRSSCLNRNQFQQTPTWPVGHSRCHPVKTTKPTSEALLSNTRYNLSLKWTKNAARCWSQGKQQSVVPPGSMSRRTERKVRAYQCWSLKIPKTEGIEWE